MNAKSVFLVIRKFTNALIKAIADSLKHLISAFEDNTQKKSVTSALKDIVNLFTGKKVPKEPSYIDVVKEAGIAAGLLLSTIMLIVVSLTILAGAGAVMVALVDVFIKFAVRMAGTLVSYAIAAVRGITISVTGSNVSKEDLTNENLNAFGISMAMDKYPSIQNIFKKLESALERPFMATISYIMDEYKAGFLSNFQHEERFLFFFKKKKEQELFVDDKASFGQLTKKLVYTIIENFKIFFKNLFEVLKNSVDIASIPLDTVIKFAKQFNLSFLKTFKKVRAV